MISTATLSASAPIISDPIPNSTTSADSAPNTRPADPRQAGFKDEIHTPEVGRYNGNVPVDDIERDPGNRAPTPEDIAQRADEIKAVGLLQPITLRDLGGNKYRIIAGETRWRAFQLLGRKTIPAHIKPKLEGADAGPAVVDVEARLIENLGRTDLNPVDEARGYKQLCEGGRTQKQVGLLFSKSQPVIANMIRMLALPESVLAQIRTGRLSAAHGVTLARFAHVPAVAEAIAECAREEEVAAKELAEKALPFADFLESEGLAYCIRTSPAYDYRHRPVMKIPPEIEKDPLFIKAGKCEVLSYYLRPEKPEDDKWLPEAKRQIAALAEREAETQRRAAADRKSGKLTPEQEAAKERKAELKRIRAEHTASFDLCLDKLRRAQEPTSAMLAVIVAGAIAGGYTHDRIKAMADAVGVKLPSGLVDGFGQGMRDTDLMAGMPVAELARVACAVILSKDYDGAMKDGSALPADIERIMNTQVAVYVPRVGDVVSWKAVAGDKEGVVIAQSEYDGVWLKEWTGNCTPVCVTKDPSTIALPGDITVVVTKALYLVKAAPPADTLLEVAPSSRPKAAAKTKPAAKAKPAKKTGKKGGRK